MDQQHSFQRMVDDFIESMRAASTNLTQAVDNLAPTLQQSLEQGATTLGQTVTPIVDSPLIKGIAKIPGLSWLGAALGQVNIANVEQSIAQLQLKHPTDSSDQLAQRIIQDATWRAAGIGLATNIIPPVALAFVVADLAAVSALQAEMVYRIAAIYGSNLHDPTRRGEVLALYLLAMGGGGLFKAGMSIPELIPGIGAILGASTDAALLFGLGQSANLYYAIQRDRVSAS